MDKFVTAVENGKRMDVLALSDMIRNYIFQGEPTHLQRSISEYIQKNINSEAAQAFDSLPKNELKKLLVI